MNSIEQRGFSRAAFCDVARHPEEHAPHTCAIRRVLRRWKQGCQRRAGLSTAQVNIAKAECVALELCRAIGECHAVEPFHTIEKAAPHLQPILEEPEKLA